MSRDEELCDYLTGSGIDWTRLDESSRAASEDRWRKIYGSIFAGRPRMRQGSKAEHAYQQENCSHFLIIPFTSNVTGLPIHIIRRSPAGFECRGPLIPLGPFHCLEFFVCPIDFAWTMVHTHEDHGYGGPFFIRQE